MISFVCICHYPCTYIIILIIGCRRCTTINYQQWCCITYCHLLIVDIISFHFSIFTDSPSFIIMIIIDLVVYSRLSSIIHDQSPIQ